MKSTSAQVSMQEYASAQTQYKASPDEDQTRSGVVPLDTLPAAWWNWLWSMVTKNNNAILQDTADMRTELLAVLTNAGITPTETQTNQLLQAIEIIRKRYPTTDASSQPIPGAVISASDQTSVSVDPNTGKMTVNALSDWTSSDSVKTAIDNIQDDIDTGIDGLRTEVTTALAGKKPMQDAVADPTASGTGVQYIASISQDANGKITATKSTVRTGSTSQTGIVQLNSDTNSTSTTVAATASAVNDVRAAAASMRFIVTNSATNTATVSGGTFLNLIWTAPGASAASVLASVAVSSIGGLTATRATYLGSSNLVTADASGNLKAHTLELT